MSIQIDKSVSEPVYQQIATGIKQMLRNGKIAPGTPMPPERMLAEQFGVSRMTMRQANELLEREGLIERQRGRGTFAAQNRIIKQEQETRSFSEEIRRRGGMPSSQVISFKSVVADAEAAEFFGIPRGASIYELQRVRLADAVPVAFESVQIQASMCPHLERFNLADHSLYEILEENYGIQLARSEEEISAIWPAAVHRKYLHLPRNTAVLLIRRKTFTAEGKPVELASTAYRGDLYTASVNSTRQSKAKPVPLH